MRGTLLDIEVGCRGGEQAHRGVGSLKPLQDLHNAHRALRTRLRSGFCKCPSQGFAQVVVAFLRPI